MSGPGAVLALVAVVTLAFRIATVAVGVAVASFGLVGVSGVAHVPGVPRLAVVPGRRTGAGYGQGRDQKGSEGQPLECAHARFGPEFAESHRRWNRSPLGSLQ